jgi:hypothetical protein
MTGHSKCSQPIHEVCFAADGGLLQAVTNPKQKMRVHRRGNKGLCRERLTIGKRWRALLGKDKGKAAGGGNGAMEHHTSGKEDCLRQTKGAESAHSMGRE